MSLTSLTAGDEKNQMTTTTITQQQQPPDQKQMPIQIQQQMQPKHVMKMHSN